MKIRLPMSLQIFSSKEVKKDIYYKLLQQFMKKNIWIPKLKGGYNFRIRNVFQIE